MLAFSFHRRVVQLLAGFLGPVFVLEVEGGLVDDLFLGPRQAPLGGVCFPCLKEDFLLWLFGPVVLIFG